MENRGSLDILMIEEPLPPLIADRYRPVRVVARGGMGVIYEVEHLHTGERLALKLLAKATTSDAESVVRFKREASVSARIKSEHVVRVLDAGVATDLGAPFLVMDLLEGADLEAYSNGKPQPRELVVEWLRQAARGLVKAHALGLVHRDLKPANLFLTQRDDGSPLLKILDFGVVKHVSLPGATLAGHAVGTPLYMAPEQASGGKVPTTPSADLFALALVAYTLLAGTTYRRGESLIEVLTEVLEPKMAPPSKRGLDLGPAFDTWFLKACAARADERFTSAEEEVEALAEALRLPRRAPEELLALSGDASSSGRVSVDRSDAKWSAPTVDANVPPTKRTVSAPPPTAPSGESGSDLAPNTAEPPAARPPRPSQRVRWAWGLALAGAASVAIFTVKQRFFRSSEAHERILSAQATAQPACRANADCAGGDPRHPSICRKDTGACVSLRTAECAELLAEEGDVANDATVWVGAMMPRHGEGAERIGPVTLRTLDLARRDFVGISNGVRSAAGSRVRPLAVVVCDDHEDAPRVAKHLVDDVGVPAIIGFYSTKSVMDLVPSLFNPKRVLALSALNTSPFLASLPRASDGTRFLYRTGADSDVAARVIAAFAARDLRPLVPPSEPLRAAVVRANNPGMLAAADAVVSRLREETNAEVTMSLVDATASQLGEVVARIAETKPHVVVVAGSGSRWVADLVLRLESAWPPKTTRPRYTLASTATLKDLADGSIGADLRSRLYAVDTPADRPANVKLALHYSEVFTPLAPEETFGPPYDAFYLLAFAIAALGDAPVTGVGLAHAIERLEPPGTPLDVGPTSILAAYNALGSGKNVDLAGTTTTLDFDLATGNATSDAILYCLKDSPQKKGLVPRASGVSFDGKTQKLSGKLDCR